MIYIIEYSTLVLIIFNNKKNQNLMMIINMTIFLNYKIKVQMVYLFIEMKN